jgi:hypothetical protein
MAFDIDTLSLLDSTNVHVPLAPIDLSDFAFDDFAANRVSYLQTAHADPRIVLPVVCRGHITAVTVILTGDASGAGTAHASGGVPSVPPSIELVRQEMGSAAYEIVASGSDAPANAAAYDVVHLFQVGGLDLPCHPRYRFYLRIYGERGLHALSNACAVLGAAVSLR